MQITDPEDEFDDPRKLQAVIGLYDAPSGHSYFSVKSTGDLPPHVRAAIETLERIWDVERPRKTFAREQESSTS